jgi:hypothetical protein
MNEIEAKIFDTEGDIFFEVNLPHIGELISFYSFADAREQKRNPAPTL